MPEMTSRQQTTHDERTLHILKEAEGSSTDFPQEIADRLNEEKSETVSTYTAEEVADVIAENQLPDRFAGPNTVPPITTFGKIVTVISESETLQEKVRNGDYTSEEIVSVIEDRWGEEYAPDEEEIPFGVRYWKRNNLDYPEFYDELEISEDIARRLSTHGFDSKESLTGAGKEDLTAVPYIGESRAEEILEAVSTTEEDDLPEPIQTEVAEPVNTGTDRAKKVILNDDDLLRQTYEAPSEAVQSVREATEDEFGVGFRPTEGSVHAAISDIWGESVDLSSDPSTTILYRCGLCGFERRDASAVKRHITSSNDMAHEDRNGNENHLVVVSGDTEMEVPGDKPEGITDTGFDVLWAVYNNPKARQKDIGRIVDMPQSSVSQKLRDLGIEWENREEQVTELFGEWMDNGGTETEEEDELYPEIEEPGERVVRETDESEERVVRETGQAKYEGPAGGLDLSGERPVSYLSEVDTSTETGGEFDLTAEEAYLLLTGGTDTPAHRKVFKAALAGEWAEEEFQ